MAHGHMYKLLRVSFQLLVSSGTATLVGAQFHKMVLEQLTCPTPGNEMVLTLSVNLNHVLYII